MSTSSLECKTAIFVPASGYLPDAQEMPARRGGEVVREIRKETKGMSPLDDCGETSVIFVESPHSSRGKVNDLRLHRF